MKVCLLIDRPKLSADSDASPLIQHINLGGSLNLTCPFQFFDNFEWFKNGQPFSNGTKDILITNVSVSDEGDCSIEFDARLNITINIFPKGTYTCCVKNEAGVNEYTYLIIVHYAPLFHNTSINNTIIDVMLASNFEILCNVSGYPNPRVSNFYYRQKSNIKIFVFIHVQRLNGKELMVVLLQRTEIYSLKM